MKGLSIFIAIVQSFFIPFLPKSLINRLYGKTEFAFIANLRDIADIPFKAGIGLFIAKLYIKYGFLNWPFVVSKIKIESEEKTKSIGVIIICPLTARQLIENKKRGALKVIQAVKFAEKIGAKSVNLAAFTSIVTNDGHDLVGKTNLLITTGNTYSALIAIQNIEKAAELIDLDLRHSTIGIVGAVGSVGSGCVRYLIGRVQNLVLIDINVKGLSELKNELRKSTFNTNISISESLSVLTQCDAVISATSAIGRIIKSEYIKQRCIVVDASHPRNVSSELIIKRKDVLVIHSAIVKIPGIKYYFDFGLGNEEVFGCLAESIIFTSSNGLHKNLVGKVDPMLMKELYDLSKELKIGPAPFRNTLGYIDQSQITFVRKIKE